MAKAWKRAGLQEPTKLRTAADWPPWPCQAQAAVRVLKLEDSMDLEGTQQAKDIIEPDEPNTPELP
ncbi:uncharacterized protein DNG_02205 [Cephalotrichum gorgonifer]|uniref:Uncharacterized protein n=1 Tax=Cephalotrichum gorgonifer TaxID=2041049 RepID=A0AAE8MU28_9PEZI|nr:uncharacterized protein DNG_02205 [Cephalotrichum gorgonifer]